MFYQYADEISAENARASAKARRKNSINTMIRAYNRISEFHQEPDPALTKFLQCLLHQIKKLNNCQEPTDQFVSQTMSELNALESHPNYWSISISYDQCTAALQKEASEATKRDRDATYNKIAKIKNHAVYIGTGPAIGIIIGSVLIAFYSLGFIVMGIGLSAFIISEAIFWLKQYQDYQKLEEKIRHKDFESDFASDDAVPLHELPQAQPVLLSEEVDKQVYAAIEVGKDLVSEVTDAVYTTMSDSLHTMWSSINSTLKPLEKTQQQLISHLHSL